MKMATFKQVSCLILTLLVSASWGQQPEKPSTNSEDLYVTATVWEKSLTTATSSITVLDRQDIENHGARTMADLLPHIPGFTLVSQGSRGGLSTGQMRGGDPNFTLVLLDGTPLNNPAYQLGDVFDLAGLSLHGIERVEVIRGPLSSFYGSTGLAGVISLITSKGSQHPLDVALEAGNGDMRSINANHSGSSVMGQHNFAINYEEESERIAAESFDQLTLRGSLQRVINEHQSLELNTSYSDWDSDDYADASGGPLFGSDELRQSQHRELNLGVVYNFGQRVRQKLEATAYRHELERQSPAIALQVPPSTEDLSLTTTRLVWQATLLNKRNWQLDSGVDIIQEDVDNKSQLLLPPQFGGNQSGDYQEDRTRGGAFLNVTGNFSKWTLELASRIDYLSNQSSQWNPRLGFRYKPNESGFSIRGSAGRAFKQPSFFATASPRALGGNPDLKPEKAYGGDLGVHYNRDRFQAELTGFYNRFENLVDFDFATFLHINRSEVQAQGFEFLTRYQPIDNLQFRINATWQDVEDRNHPDEPLRHHPRWVGGFLVTWQPSSELQLTLDSKSISEAYDQQIPVMTRFTTAGYTLWGGSVTYTIHRTWYASLRLDNLSNKDYETLIGHPGPELGYRLSLGYRP
jgi:iron complex outermembrane receptor protein/vitamin B12 transporter